MKEEPLEKKFLQSYLYTDYGNFFISTAYRRASTPEPSWYYDTFAWNLNDNNERTDCVADNSGAGNVQGALKQHFEVLEELEKTGEFKSRS